MIKMTVCIASLLRNCSFHSAGTSNYLLEELKCAKFFSKLHKDNKNHVSFMFHFMLH